MPFFLFVPLLVFFFFFSQGWLKNGRQGGVLLRLDKGAKEGQASHGLLRTELFLLFFFFRFNHISIELNNDTTRTQMYLLSVMVYYDSIFYYNLATNLPVCCCHCRGPRRWCVHLEGLTRESFHHSLKSLTPNPSYFWKCERLHPERE